MSEAVLETWVLVCLARHLRYDCVLAFAGIRWEYHTKHNILYLMVMATLRLGESVVLKFVSFFSILGPTLLTI